GRELRLDPTAEGGPPPSTERLSEPPGHHGPFNRRPCSGLRPEPERRFRRPWFRKGQPGTPVARTSPEALPSEGRSPSMSKRIPSVVSALALVLATAPPATAQSVTLPPSGDNQKSSVSQRL